MRRVAVAAFSCGLLPSAVSAQLVPPPDAALVAALTAARGAGLGTLAAWAAQPVPPASGGDAVASAQRTIVALAPPDRDALLYWLSAHGRAALHARGASDADIGVPYFPIDYGIVPAPFPSTVTPLIVPPAAPAATPSPAPRRHHTHFGLLGSLLPALQIPIASSSSSSSSTTQTRNGNSTEIDQTTQSSGMSASVGGNPWEAVGSLIDASIDRSTQRAAPPASPWRTLPFARSALGGPGSRIAVLRGFAAVRTDGTEGAACISFMNQSPVSVTRLDVDIEILDGLGLIKRVQQLRRAGSFAGGVEIGGPGGPQTIDEARANCVIDGENSLADPTDPFSRASSVVYSVRQVVYADGTAWLEPGANPW